MAHAEASARTVEAAVTAAAAQLGLRSDQVDIEVLEEPVPSTFGYIGTPARVRVTPRAGAAPTITSTIAHAAQAPAPGSAGAPAAPSDASPADDVGDAGLADGAGDDGLKSEPAPGPRPSEPTSSDVPPTAAPPSTVGVSDATSDPEGTGIPAPTRIGSGAGSDEGRDASGRAESSPVPVIAATPSTSTPARSELSSSTKPSRRTHHDEQIEPELVEADTERAGDFLEGLLDALDVDGDITTWIDEVGGHIDLEGPDLDVLVGPNGETLDALQELTRLAVLRQSKRRARLLLDINGFRARQREQLVAEVRATVEQVIRTREEHEFQPMTPAERKIVHDAVASIDGASTESLGEEPNRRVVIRPT